MKHSQNGNSGWTMNRLHAARTVAIPLLLAALVLVIELAKTGT